MQGNATGSTAENAGQAPRLCAGYPQLFVTDMARAVEFYTRRLGFSVGYLYGEPPFYGLMMRDGVDQSAPRRPAVDGAISQGARVAAQRQHSGRGCDRGSVRGIPTRRRRLRPGAETAAMGHDRLRGA